MGKVRLGRAERQFTKRIAFDGTDGGGATGTAVLVATVTGRVILTNHNIHCLITLVGTSATVELGTASDTDSMIAVTTATSIDSTEFWLPGPVTAVAGGWDTIQNTTVAENIIVTPKTANVTAGMLEFVFMWLPASLDGKLS